MATGTAASTKIFDQVEENWGWFFSLGLGLLLAGFVASTNLFATTLISVFYIAAMMFVGGALQVVHAVATQGWARRVLYVISAVLYAFAGAVVVHDPILSAVGVSLAVGALLMASGLFKIISAVRDRGKSGWGWIAASGLLTLAVGCLIVASWPGVGMWLLGSILTVDLIFQGWGFLAFGIALRARGKSHVGGESVHA